MASKLSRDPVVSIADYPLRPRYPVRYHVGEGKRAVSQSDKSNGALTMPDPQQPSKNEMTIALNRALAAVDPASGASLDELMGLLERMARAHRMKRIAQQTGLGEKSLYKSMRTGARPEVGTVLRVLGALGYRLQAIPIEVSSRQNFEDPLTGLQCHQDYG